MGGPSFLEYMSFRMTCITETFVLREVMLCWTTCIKGKSCRSACLQNGISFRMMSYWNAYFTGGKVLLEVCLIGGHV